MAWQRLDRDTTHEIINSVKSAAEPGLISTTASEVERAWLPFYKDFYLYRITNFAALPSFTFEYLGDGKFFHYLDGTTDPIYAVNDKKILHLNEIHVVDYLAFYFKHVTDPEDGDIVLVRNPHDMPMLDSLGPAAVQAVIQNHKPPRVERLDGDKGYMAKVDLYVDGILLRATINVDNSGRVNITDRKMIMNQVAQSAETGNFVV